MMEKTREGVLETYQEISDKLMSVIFDEVRVSSPVAGSVAKSDLQEQIIRMQTIFHEGLLATLEEDAWDTCNVVFFGETNAGKSTLIEALRLYYGDIERKTEVAWGAGIGDGHADFTTKPAAYDVNIGSCTLRLTDLPGIEGKEENFSKDIENELRKANVVLYLVGNGKKIERETLKRVKSYLRQDARVYAVCNVHCLGKAHRDPVLDKPYTDELMKKMEDVQRKAAVQIAEELGAVLGEIYRGIYAMNAHLAFAAAAYDANRGGSLITPDRKELIGAQKIYAREFADNYEAMCISSRLDMIVTLLRERAENFYTERVEQETRKLLRLISELFTHKGEEMGALAVLRVLQEQMERERDAYRSACEDAVTAQQRFERQVARIPKAVASKYRTKYQDLMHKKIEHSWDGKIKEEYVRRFMSKREREMQSFVEEEVQKKVEGAVSELSERYKQISEHLNAVGYAAQRGAMGIRFSGSNFQEDGIGLGSIALKGIGVALEGVAIRGLIGGIAGFIGLRITTWWLGPIAIVGTLGFELIKYLMGADERLAKAKAKATEFFEKQEEAVAESLREALMEYDIKGQVRVSCYEPFVSAVEQTILSYEQMNTVIEDVATFFDRLKLEIGGYSHGKV